MYQKRINTGYRPSVSTHKTGYGTTSKHGQKPSMQKVKEIKYEEFFLSGLKRSEFINLNITNNLYMFKRLITCET